jgi:hypothetical protein
MKKNKFTLGWFFICSRLDADFLQHMVLFYYGRNSGCQSYRGCEGIFHLGQGW